MTTPYRGQTPRPESHVPGFVRFISRRPWTALLIGVVCWATTWVGLPHVTANFTHTAFFKKGDPLLERFNAFERQFGNDDAIVVVIHSPSGVFDMETAQLLQKLTEKMWLIPEVIRVDSLANFQWVHAIEDEIEVEPLLPDDIPLTEKILAERKKVALEHETLPDYLVSKDGKTALLYARIKPGIDKPPNSPLIVKETRKLLETFKGGDHEFHITGGPAINFAFQEVSQRDMSRLVPIVVLMIVLFLTALLRRVSGVLLPLMVVGMSVVSSVGFAGILGVEFSTITTVLPQALIAIGIADSVHVLSGFFQARRRGLEKAAAATHTLSKNLLPTVLTSLSTSIGFFAFVTADLKPVYGLGLIVGIGTIVAWFISYLVLGSLLYILPSRAVKPERQKKTSVHEASERAYAYVDWLQAKRKLIVVVFLALSGGAAYLALGNQVNSDPYKYFAESYPLRQAQDFIMNNLGGVTGFEFIVDAGKEDGIKDPEFLRKVETWEKQIAEIPGVTKAVSIVDVLRQLNRSLNGGKDEHYKLPGSKQAVAQELLLYTSSLPQGMDVNNRITVKNDAIRVTVISKISDSARWTQTSAKMEKMAANLGIVAKSTGKGMLYQSMNGYVVQSFVTSLSIAVVLISLLLFVFFRSIKVGLISLLPNLMPLLFGGAILKLLGGTLDIGTVLVASVCFGIAVDDTIHVVANYTSYIKQGMTQRDAVARVFSHTGPALIVTTLVLAVGFGTLAFATFVPNIYFGIMTASILTIALITDLTFLPVALLMTGRDQKQASSEPAPEDAVSASGA